METLNNDILLSLGMELNLDSLIKFCKTSKKINSIVCNNNMFWYNKLKKDYPDAYSNIPKGANYEKIYKSVATSKWSYYTIFKTFPKKGKITKISDYVKKGPGFYNDLDYIASIDPDFEPHHVLSKSRGNMAVNKSIQQLIVKGIYPQGTKIWLYFSDEIGHIGSAATREKAIEKLLIDASGVLDRMNWYPENTTFENVYRVTPNDIRNALATQDSFLSMGSHSNEQQFVIKEVTLP